MTADEIIGALRLAPHPEGGHYRETFRDLHDVGRPASTAIYYLLKAGERSRWHKVDAVEIWHFYAGAPLSLMVAEDGGARRNFRLGPGVIAGDTPQVVVPRHAWQSAESLGPWTLVGCTVAPGFEFAGLTMAPADWEPG